MFLQIYFKKKLTALIKGKMFQTDGTYKNVRYVFLVFIFLNTKVALVFSPSSDYNARHHSVTFARVILSVCALYTRVSNQGAMR